MARLFSLVTQSKEHPRASGGLCNQARFVPGRVSFVSCFDLGKGMDLLLLLPANQEHMHCSDTREGVGLLHGAQQRGKPRLTLRGCATVVCIRCTRLGLQMLHHHSLNTRSPYILTRVKWLHRRYYSYGRGGRVCAFTINPGARGVSGRSQTNNHPRLPRNRHSQVEKRRAPCCQGRPVCSLF
jgi:hypothetical protein